MFLKLLQCTMAGEPFTEPATVKALELGWTPRQIRYIRYLSLALNIIIPVSIAFIIRYFYD